MSVREVHFSAQEGGLKESASAKAIEEREASWAADVPKDESGLWDWLAGLDGANRSSLLAHCVSYGVNALHEKVDRYGGTGVSAHGLRQRLAQADRLARAVNLDMVEAGWSPSVRLFEATACGTPIVSDVWAGMEEVLTPGVELLQARGASDVLAALARPEAERQAIGEAGRARTLRQHTGARRAAELEQCLAGLWETAEAR